MRAFSPFQIAHAVWALIGLSSRTVNVTQVDGVALDTHDAGSMPSDVRTWLGTAPSALIAGRVDANAQVVGDKTGYSLAADQAVNTTKWSGVTVTTTGGLPDVSTNLWRGGLPNTLIAGRIDCTAQVVGDKTGYSLTAGSYVVRASSSQRATVSFATGDTNLNITIASVTTTRASAAGSGRTSGTSNAERGLITVQITAATTVNAVRDSSGSTAVAAAEVWELF